MGFHAKPDRIKRLLLNRTHRHSPYSSIRSAILQMSSRGTDHSHRSRELAGGTFMATYACPNCQHQNPIDAAFCMNCGSKLTRACTNCGTNLPGNARFCSNCGQPVAVSTPTDETYRGPSACRRCTGRCGLRRPLLPRGAAPSEEHTDGDHGALPLRNTATTHASSSAST